MNLNYSRTILFCFYYLNVTSVRLEKDTVSVSLKFRVWTYILILSFCIAFQLNNQFYISCTEDGLVPKHMSTNIIKQWNNIINIIIYFDIWLFFWTLERMKTSISQTTYMVAKKIIIIGWGNKRVLKYFVRVDVLA